MSSKTAARTMQTSAILQMAGGLLGEVASVAGTDTGFGKTLAGIGSVASRISQLGVQASTVMALQGASTDQINNALINAGPIVTQAAAGKGTAPAEDPAGKQPIGANTGTPAVGAPAAGNGGVFAALFDVVAAPFRLLARAFGGK